MSNDDKIFVEGFEPAWHRVWMEENWRLICSLASCGYLLVIFGGQKIMADRSGCLQITNIIFSFYKKLLKYQQIFLIFSEIREKSDCIMGTKHTINQIRDKKYIDKVASLIPHKLSWENGSSFIPPTHQHRPDLFYDNWQYYI